MLEGSGGKSNNTQTKLISSALVVSEEINMQASVEWYETHSTRTETWALRSLHLTIELSRELLVSGHTICFYGGGSQSSGGKSPLLSTKTKSSVEIV